MCVGLGYVTPYSIGNTGSVLFSVVYIFFGIFLFALIDRNVFRGNCAKSDSVRHSRLLYMALLILSWILLGVLWTSMSLNLAFIDSLLFSFSSLWAWGIFSLSSDVNNDLSDGNYVLASFYSFFGAILVYLFYSYLASEVEVAIEKYILMSAAKEDFTLAELTYLKTVRNWSGQGADSGMDMLLTYEEVKQVILRRVRDLDVSSVFRSIRSWLPIYYFICMVLGLLFYMFYGESDSWSTALNFTLSSWSH